MPRDTPPEVLPSVPAVTCWRQSDDHRSFVQPLQSSDGLLTPSGGQKWSLPVWASRRSSEGWGGHMQFPQISEEPPGATLLLLLRLKKSFLKSGQGGGCPPQQNGDGVEPNQGGDLPSLTSWRLGTFDPPRYATGGSDFHTLKHRYKASPSCPRKLKLSSVTLQLLFFKTVTLLFTGNACKQYSAQLLNAKENCTYLPLF